MQPDSEYLNYLMAPLSEAVALSPSAYVAALTASGIQVAEWIYINKKFLAHFEHLIAIGKVRNAKGSLDLQDFGFYVGVDRALSIIEPCRILKTPEAS